MIASRWKAVFDEERVQRDELETRIKENRAAVREQMGDIRKQHETELLRQELAHHQAQGLRLMQRLSERESSLMPPVSGATIYPQGAPPLFPVGDQEVSCVEVDGVGGRHVHQFSSSFTMFVVGLLVLELVQCTHSR